jgi:hypothetical protein
VTVNPSSWVKASHNVCCSRSGGNTPLSLNDEGVSSGVGDNNALDFEIDSEESNYAGPRSVFAFSGR